MPTVWKITTASKHIALTVCFEWGKSNDLFRYKVWEIPKIKNEATVYRNEYRWALLEGCHEAGWPNPHKQFKREDVQHREASFDWCLLQHQHIAGFNIALILSSMMRFYLLQLCTIFGFLIFQCQAYQQHHQQSKDFTFTYFS